jgi:PEGA domain
MAVPHSTSSPFTIALVAGWLVGCAPSSAAGPIGARETTRSSMALATLQVAEPSGALLYVDGEAVGVVPLSSALPLEPGIHEVALFVGGHEPYRGAVELSPGEDRVVSLDLGATPQRIVSSVLLGVGAASLTAGIAFGAVAAAKRGGASDATRSDGAEPLSLGAGLSGGLGALLTITGGTLFVLDVPALPDGPKPAAIQIGPTGMRGRF